MVRLISFDQDEDGTPSLGKYSFRGLWDCLQFHEDEVRHSEARRVRWTYFLGGREKRRKEETMLQARWMESGRPCDVLSVLVLSGRCKTLFDVMHEAWHQQKFGSLLILKVILLDCGHVCACADCANNLLRMKRGCPVCRS